jgi:hypothetical protein
MTLKLGKYFHLQMVNSEYSGTYFVITNFHVTEVLPVLVN